jgi:hypothetical protein
MTLKTMVRGREYDVTVSDDGVFRTTDANGNRVHAPSLPELKVKLGKAAVKVSVPYTRYVEQYYNTKFQVTDGEFTGRHADGHRLLAREGGKAAQYGLHDRTFLRRLTDDEREDLTARIVAKQNADARLKSFLEVYALGDARKLIDEAAEAAADHGREVRAHEETG